MTVMDRLAARAMQTILGRFARPPATLWSPGRNCPHPRG